MRALVLSGHPDVPRRPASRRQGDEESPPRAQDRVLRYATERRTSRGEIRPRSGYHAKGTST